MHTAIASTGADGPHRHLRAWALSINCKKGRIFRCDPLLSMGYKKDIFGIFAYEFELLPKNLEFSYLVCGGEPPSVDQWLHHFETAYKNHRDLFLGIYR